MGFMDKAKKMAEQAQAKLDEVQKSVNTTQGGPPAGGAPVVEYDKHGRPLQPDAAAAPVATPGVPPTSTGPTPDPSSPPPSSPPPATPGVPAAAAPTPDPAAPAPRPPAPPAAAAPGGPPPAEDRNRPSTEPPKLSSGDPLAG